MHLVAWRPLFVPPGSDPRRRFAAPAQEGLHQRHLAQITTLDDGAGQLVQDVLPTLVSHLDDAPGPLRRVHEGVGALDGVAHALLDVDVAARLHGRHGHGHVQVIRRRDDDGVDLLGVEQLAVVDVRG